MTGAETKAPAGRLVLVPNTLDLGTLRDGELLPDLRQVLPQGVIERAAGLRHWVAENAKSTRAFLKRVHEIVPLAAPLQSLDIRELPRPTKGRPDTAAASGTDLKPLLTPAAQGHDVGLISEAGLPGVADPGAAVVRAAHQLGIVVEPLPGPSSLVLAVAASGLNGQSFAFVGYLPTDKPQRAQRIRELEQISRRAGQTQLVIETPYRNAALLDALLENLNERTWLSVSCGLTLAGGFTRSDTVAGWRAHSRPLPDDIPTVFAWLGT